MDMEELIFKALLNYELQKEYVWTETEDGELVEAHDYPDLRI